MILTTTCWAIIAPQSPGRGSDPGRTGPDPRLFAEAVLRLARTGCLWRDLPPEHGKRHTVVKRICGWVRPDAARPAVRALSDDADLDGDLIAGLSCDQFLADRAIDANRVGEALAGYPTAAVRRRSTATAADRGTRSTRVRKTTHRIVFRPALSRLTLGKIKEYRAIANRCCKTDKGCSAPVSLAASVIRSG